MGLSSLKEGKTHSTIKWRWKMFIFLLTWAEGRAKSSGWGEAVERMGIKKVKPHDVSLNVSFEFSVLLAFGWLHDWGLLTFSMISFRSRICWCLRRSFKYFCSFVVWWLKPQVPHWRASSVPIELNFRECESQSIGWTCSLFKVVITSIHCHYLPCKSLWNHSGNISIQTANIMQYNNWQNWLSLIVNNISPLKY